MKTENIFVLITIALLIGALLLVYSIVRDVFPMLSADDQAMFVNRRIGRNRETNRALGNVWKIHVEAFPKSRKRWGLGCLLVATFLSVMGYPLWLALSR